MGAEIDHRAVPFAQRIHRDAATGMPVIETPEMATNLGRQGLVEISVVLAAMTPVGAPDVGGAAQRLRDAVSHQDREGIAAALSGQDRAQVRDIVLALARGLPADVDAAQALAWLED